MQNIYRFPQTKPVEWENIFPSLTRREEIDLVDRLIRYNPKSRWTAQEVSSFHQFHCGVEFDVKLITTIVHFYHSMDIVANKLLFFHSQALCHEYFNG
jgi:hypothetical protein